MSTGDPRSGRDTRAGGEHNRREALTQLSDRHIRADLHAAAQLDALCHQLLDATLDDRLLDLEVGHPEAHEPTSRLVALEQRDAVAGAAQLLGSRHARG